jgi:peptidoglycan hydrolase CwlO-like protein
MPSGAGGDLSEIISSLELATSELARLDRKITNKIQEVQADIQGISPQIESMKKEIDNLQTQIFRLDEKIDFLQVNQSGTY